MTPSSATTIAYVARYRDDESELVRSFLSGVQRVAVRHQSESVHRASDF